MNIALIAHDAKKELMVQFCIAYCGLLSRHTLCATGTTGKLVAEATGLKVQRFLSGVQGGDQQIAARIACNEVDLLLFFRDPLTAKPQEPNDMNMLLEVGFGVAMANAVDEVKRAADVITASNDEEGVAEAIEKYVLNIVEK